LIEIQLLAAGGCRSFPVRQEGRMQIMDSSFR
jgi:hypothetical protein